MLLTEKEVRQYLLAHGKVYIHSCDDCKEKLIAVGELCVVLKWEKRTDGFTFLGRIPKKVRCMECDERLHPKMEKLNSTKISNSEAASVGMHPVVQKLILSLIKHNEIPRDELLLNLRKKKVVRELKKSDVSRTLRGLRKLKAIKVKNGIWVIAAKKKRKVNLAATER